MENVYDPNQNNNQQQQYLHNPYQQHAGQPLNRQPYNMKNLNQQPDISYPQMQDNQKQFQNLQNSIPQNNLPQYQYPRQYPQPYNSLNAYRQPDMQYNQPYMRYQQTKNNDGTAVASLICGISSLILICFIGFFAVVPAVIGLVLGIIGINHNDGAKGLAIAGIVTSAITILFGILIIVITFGLIIFFLDLLFGVIM